MEALANISIVSVKQQLLIQPEIKDEFIKKLTAVNELKSQDAQSICLLIGTLQISELLEANLIKLIIVNMNNSIEYLSLE